MLNHKRLASLWIFLIILREAATLETSTLRYLNNHQVASFFNRSLKGWESLTFEKVVSFRGKKRIGRRGDSVQETSSIDEFLCRILLPDFISFER